ncbi:DoxX family protein [Kocuria marina]|uniref:Uncharacterized membrane protein n=1 Tax=Kocuria marina subsp. indica TaxID=1049583 RepID=A0A1X7CQ56_9MICC|nr:hypothetical protein [Kocuria indica]OXS84066.1 hypothetical protein B1B07_04305 [Kocuria indica]RLP58361.1 hypothetical protein D9R06_04725 [Kocuria indica]SMF00652.1 Uncharacterized membrane protein [Kocuria indica]
MVRITKALQSLTAPSPKPTATETAARLALGAFMSTAGISHLTFAREDFQAQVPDWFPMDKDTVVLASGVVEIAFGAALLALPRQRAAVGAGLAAFYAAIFPGNISQYAERHDAFNLDTDAKRLARLFGQPALIAAALRAGGFPRK